MNAICDTVRRHGKSPYVAALLHGGPGACGEMSAVARELFAITGRGLLEPWQSADSVAGQCDELKLQLESCAAPPLTLIGYSWGAWLALIFAAEHPEAVKKLVLISCGPLDEKYAASVEDTRRSRLSETERIDYAASLRALSGGAAVDGQRQALARLRELTMKSDCFDPLPADEREGGVPDFRSDIFGRVWPEAAELRRGGTLLAYAARIACPVLALHGAFDPHPSEGVRAPLSKLLNDFCFIEIAHCGHTPWRERQVRDEFMRRLSATLL